MNRKTELMVKYLWDPPAEITKEQRLRKEPFNNCPRCFQDLDSANDALSESTKMVPVSHWEHWGQNQ